MVVVLSSYELVNIAFYILLPWDKLSSTNAVAVAAATSLLGRPAGILITVLVALSCGGSITSNVFTAGRLTVAAAQRHYLPAFLSKRGLPRSRTASSEEDFASYTEFLRYLGAKDRAGVAKFDDGTTLFLVPPSDFLYKVLNVVGPERLYGVVLKFPQHAPIRPSMQPQSLNPGSPVKS